MKEIEASVDLYVHCIYTAMSNDILVTFYQS